MDDLRDGAGERATWVTRALLEELVPAEYFSLWTDCSRMLRAHRTRAILRRAAPFVALVDQDRTLTRLVNRQVLLEEIATSLGEKPEPGTDALE